MVTWGAEGFLAPGHERVGHVPRMSGTHCCGWVEQLNDPLPFWLMVFVALALAGWLAFRLRRALFLRLPCWLLAHSVYRVRLRGPHNLPANGPALLVCNGLRWIDVGLLLAV